MILLETNDIYYNTQVYFRKNLMDGLPNNDKAWAKAYHAWLKTQGAVIVTYHGDVLHNSLGIAPGFDYFGFKDPKDATWFRLRWS